MIYLYLTLYLLLGYCAYALSLRWKWKWLEYICMVAVGPVDIFLNYTFFVLMTSFDFPVWGEWTYSMRLERLVLDQGKVGKTSRDIAALLNRIIPGHITNYKP